MQIAFIGVLCVRQVQFGAGADIQLDNTSLLWSAIGKSSLLFDINCKSINISSFLVSSDDGTQPLSRIIANLAV